MQLRYLRANSSALPDSLICQMYTTAHVPRITCKDCAQHGNATLTHTHTLTTTNLCMCVYMLCVWRVGATSGCCRQYAVHTVSHQIKRTLFTHWPTQLRLLSASAHQRISLGLLGKQMEITYIVHPLHCAASGRKDPPLPHTHTHLLYIFNIIIYFYQITT